MIKAQGVVIDVHLVPAHQVDFLRLNWSCFVNHFVQGVILTLAGSGFTVPHLIGGYHLCTIVSKMSQSEKLTSIAQFLHLDP